MPHRRRRPLGLTHPIAMLVAAAVLAAPPQEDPPASTDEEMTTLKSGLQYVDLVVGEGKEVQKGDEVSVHYTGWLTDGTKFDSSRDRGATFSFPVGAGRVIRGWEQGVLGMKVGGKRKLVIPPKLAYGKRGAGDVIPPDATLIFEIELFSAN